MKKNQIDLYSATVLWFCLAVASMVAVCSFSSYRHGSSCVSWLYPCQVRGVVRLTADATSDVGCAAGIVVTASGAMVSSLKFWREGTHSQGPSNIMGYSSTLNMEIPSPIPPIKRLNKYPRLNFTSQPNHYDDFFFHKKGYPDKRFLNEPLELESKSCHITGISTPVLALPDIISSTRCTSKIGGPHGVWGPLAMGTFPLELQRCYCYHRCSHHYTCCTADFRCCIFSEPHNTTNLTWIKSGHTRGSMPVWTKSPDCHHGSHC